MNGQQSLGFLLRIYMDINVIFEMVTASCHLTSLRQLHVNRSTNPASHRSVEIFALPGCSKEVFRPLHSSSLRIPHLINETCKLPFVLTLETLYRCQIWRVTWMVYKHDALLLNLWL